MIKKYNEYINEECMIKKYNEYINEDYFSKLAKRKDNCDKRKENEVTEDFVKSFVNKDFENKIKSISIRKENDKTIVDIDGDFVVDVAVEEIPFQFGKVTGNFNCTDCALKSLEGCPQKVGGDFNCSFCKNLTSLKGCPQEVDGDFFCSMCRSLTSLEGCPKYVHRHFSCSYCDKLASLEGCPREVGGDFFCYDCGKKFTVEKTRTLCKVKGDVSV